MFQNFLASFGVGLWMFDRIVLGRILCDTGKCRTFGQIQFPDVFIEILSCRSLHAVCAGSKVDGVQIVLKNYILIVDLIFHLDGKILFLEFSGETLQPGAFLGPVGKHIIFQKLLGNGAGALGKVAGGDISYKSTENTSHINTVMFIKTFILNSHYSMLEINRDLLNGNRKTVRIGSRQLAELISLAVIQECCVTQRGNIDLVYIRGVVYDPAEGSDTHAAHGYTQRDQSDKQNSDKRNMSTLSHHGCTGNQRISFSGD